MPANLGDITVGKPGFIERHGLWTDEQKEAVRRIKAEIETRGLETIRVSVADQHGILRSKTLTVRSFMSTLRNGVDFITAPFAFDTANSIVFNPFEAGGGFGHHQMSGAPDAILVPDPLTFRVLPWASGTGWILGDLYFDSGEPLPYAPRNVMRKALGELEQAGFEYFAGLEVEWYLTKLEDPMLEPEHLGSPGIPPTPPRVRAVSHGFQYLLESHLDEVDPIIQILRKNLEGAGLPLRTMEDEWGPGQQEFTFDPFPGLAAADAMVFFRTATKQICRRHGYHATFMCKPNIPNFYASGWHLHESLLYQATGENAFVSTDAEHPLSQVGLHFVGGILAHANAACVFTTPTINGYKRVKPYSLAPDRVTWGIENRGAMVRVQGGVNDPATHVENRVGEPAANPYLYMASQIVSGLDGMRQKIDPGPPSEVPYAATDRPSLPKTLMEAVNALKQDTLFREKFGNTFLDFIITLKEFEANRFLTYLESTGMKLEDTLDVVTDWEHREYFDLF